jgi:hypothetical protein
LSKEKGNEKKGARSLDRPVPSAQSGRGEAALVTATEVVATSTLLVTGGGVAGSAETSGQTHVEPQWCQPTTVSGL